MPISQSVPKVFTNYINKQKLENVELLKIKKVKFTITQKEAYEDLHVFQYIINNSYSGREYWENQGVDFKKIYDNIGAYINSNNLVPIHEMFNLFCKQLQGIHDGHLSLSSFNNCINFGKKYKAYFADVLLEKSNDKFEVIFSKVNGLPVESIFIPQEIAGKVFRTLSPSGKEHYLLGYRSWDKIDKITISSNKKVISLPVHPCRASDSKQDEVGIFNKTTVYGFNIVTSKKFWEWDDKICDDFYNCGLSLRNESILIWNLMNNGGGNSDYPLQFIKGLNEYSYWKINCAKLNSPSISQARGVPFEDIQNKREWTLLSSANEQDNSKGIFNGALYILSNDGIASSGEAALNIARSVPNSIIVGQNSSGVGVFGDVLTYQLPYSDILMNVPYKLFLGGAKEGEGFEPDYWIDSNDVQGELIDWLKRPLDYRALR